MATKKISFGRPTQSKTVTIHSPSQAEMDAWVSAGAERTEKAVIKAHKAVSKRIVLEVEEDVHKKFKMLCAHFGSSVSSVLRSHIDELLEAAPEEIFKK